MNLYLDEDTAWGLLVQALRRAGHDVQVPAGVGLTGKWDPVQMLHAIQEGRAILTRNYCDYHDLHSLIDAAGGHHPGILVIRRDDNTRRNMTPRDVVRALRNLEAGGTDIADHYIILNAWQ